MCDDECQAQPTEMKVLVDKYFERPDAMIYLLHDFVSPEECKELINRATPRLARAAVTGDAPGEKVGR